jgi:hypothetical protein
MDDFTKKSVEKFDKSTVRAAEKLIDSSPELKKIRSIKDGLTPRGITTGANDQQYKDGYDKIEWGKNKSKPSFKVRVNGVVQNDEET